MLVNKPLLVFAALSMFTVGCDSDNGDSAQAELEAQTQEIVANLEVAGYPASEIEVVDGYTVMVGGDAEVTLEASREIAGMRQVEATLDSDQEFRQYSTTNLVSSSVKTICVNGSAYTGTLSTALNNAIANYNSQNLSFTMTRTSGSTVGCDAVIKANKVSGNGGEAGFPSGGLPYSQINIGTKIATYGTAVTTHVITHELGHCIGFRHSDYYNRAISCGGSASNEGSAGIGANNIPGTPTTATANGSIMNSCFNLGSTGVWTSTDVTALDVLYGDNGGGGGGGGPQVSPTSCYGACGGNAGQCWCDSSCAQYGDCCADKANYCG